MNDSTPLLAGALALALLSTPLAAGNAPAVTATPVRAADLGLEVVRLSPRVVALDYLTKPIDPQRFEESLARARASLEPRSRVALEDRLLAMLEAQERRQAARAHLVV